ncbi:MAG: DUF2127 domain-containing protein [Gemmatimonadaceae bacterium]|nr:DUF2127 domain-containing protein [Gemmatimonadaceae bacterium]
MPPSSRAVAPAPRAPHGATPDSGPVETFRGVAAFEASKGVLVILAGLGVLSWNRWLRRVVAIFVGHLHLNPAKHHPHIFELIADGASTHMTLLAAGAAVYVIGRFVEAFGLWHGKRWAVWLAAGTAAIYLPFEVVELARRPGLVPIGALLVNLGIVVYLLRRTYHRA